jgi:hypothetical protein
MSQTSTTAEASATSRFQAIFQAALKSYQKQTKKDLLAHPLSSQLQSCNSTTAILAILQDQVREFDESRSGDERLTKWLGPTVNVLSAFSAAVSGGVSLVSLDSWTELSPQASSNVYSIGIFACECDLRGNWCLPFSEYPIQLFVLIILTLWMV